MLLRRDIIICRHSCVCNENPVNVMGAACQSCSSAVVLFPVTWVSTWPGHKSDSYSRKISVSALWTGKEDKTWWAPQANPRKSPISDFTIYGSHFEGMCYTELTIAFMSSLSQTWSHGQDQNNVNNNGRVKAEGVRWYRGLPTDYRQLTKSNFKNSKLVRFSVDTKYLRVKNFWKGLELLYLLRNNIFEKHVTSLIWYLQRINLRPRWKLLFMLLIYFIALEIKCKLIMHLVFGKHGLGTNYKI